MASDKEDRGEPSSVLKSVLFPKGLPFETPRYFGSTPPPR